MTDLDTTANVTGGAKHSFATYGEAHYLFVMRAGAWTLVATSAVGFVLSACVDHSATAPSHSAVASHATPTAAPRKSAPATSRGTAGPVMTATSTARQRASSEATDTSRAVSTFLALAHAALPAQSRAMLSADGHRICRQLAQGSSADDVTGDLAARLGSQSVAHQFVVDARSAYCP
ncbi:DUF732 domain-containing protein [uncultured Jatrophihabitans sp.]|uniref:DUF732 domain-containing protein n=1 Tax=uncultured Jatrophihabitans sp. TaxID=1610747 RepID=UPI0035CB1E56